MAAQTKKGFLVRVGPNLYRHSISKRYSGLIKVGKRQIKKAFKTTDPHLAKRRLAEFRETMRRRHGDQGTNLRFEELAQMWLESIKADLKETSYLRRKTSIRGLILHFGALPMRSIGFSQIDQWKSKRSDRVSAQTFNIDRETLNLIFRYAIDRNILVDNPASKLKRRRVTHRKVRTFSEREFRILMDDLKQAPRAVFTGAADMIGFLAESGVRVGEAEQICLRDINLEDRRIRITGGATGTKNYKERFIPIFPDLRPYVLRLLEKHQGKSPSDRLFPIKSPRKALDLACVRLGFGHFNVHSLRHYFASNAVQRGVNFKRVAEWLGHSDGGTLVARVYGHLRPETENDDVAKMKSRPSEE